MKKLFDEWAPIGQLIVMFLMVICVCVGIRIKQAYWPSPPPTPAPIYTYTIILESGQEVVVEATECTSHPTDLRGLAESHPLLLEVDCWGDEWSFLGGDVFSGLAVAVIRR